MNVRDDPNMKLLVGLFAKAAAIPLDDATVDDLWRLLECAYSAGAVAGIKEARAVVAADIEKREQESKQAALRG